MKNELDQLLTSMIQSADGVSDLLFVTDKPPQLENHGKLKPFIFDISAAALTSARIEGWARVIINENQRLLQDLAKTGSCDCSYSLPICRFRVNIYRQNGNYAMVLRKLQTQIPSFENLKLAPVFREVIHEKNGIIFAYLGSGDPPPFPNYDCFAAPDEYTFAFKGLWECNWLQGLEGGIGFVIDVIAADLQVRGCWDVRHGLPR